MGKDTIVINIDHKNISQYSPGSTCFLNPKHEGAQKRLEWLIKRFSEGLKIKLLYSERDRKVAGFIEYIPGENAWRSVDAKGYMFIHCIWTYPNKYKNKGHASLLIKECIEDAKRQGKIGVAVITSEGPFMAGKDVFLKNGFESVASAEPSFELMVKTLKKGPLPKFMDWGKQLSTYKGLNIVYANQCPWVARSIEVLAETAKEKGLKLKVTELKTAKQAQNSPSVYAVFNLVYNSKLLADHYISNTRFLNIINKEIK